MNQISATKYRPRIFIHAPFETKGYRARVKDEFLAAVRRMQFEPQEFGVSGLPTGDSWTFKRAIEVMRRCDGALILALTRSEYDADENRVRVPSEYSHFEGALALSCHLPTIVVGEAGMERRGILSEAAGSFVLELPMNRAGSWEAKALTQTPPFKRWGDRVRARYDVFFGYCSKANRLAKNIKSFLTRHAGMRVLDWATDFRTGSSIMDEIARATATCRCGLFLFTKDDPIMSSSKKVVPRDNVLLEAGYFMSAHSARRMVVVRESRTKMPADLGGMIYLTIGRRGDWKKTAAEVARALSTQMNEDL